MSRIEYDDLVTGKVSCEEAQLYRVATHRVRGTEISIHSAMKIGTIIVTYACMYLASIRLTLANSATMVRDYRLELHDNQVSHNEAKTNCESRGAWLVEIKDKEIDDAVETLVPTDAIWIGLSYDEQWRWSDGSPIHYEYWRNDADLTPNKNTNHVCVRRGSSDWWLNVNCNSNLRYICQSDTTYPGSFNITVKDQEMNFQEAKAKCQADGAVLIDIKTAELNTFAVRTVSDKSGKYWTGGNNIGHTGTYKWGDGTVISDNNPGWYKGSWSEPNNKHQSYYCVAIEIASSWKGWVDVHCSSRAYPICQKNVTCDNNICSNHGSCEIVGTRYKCSCDSGYFGTKCESGPPTVGLSVTELVLPVEENSKIVACKATGVPKPYATWMKDGKKVSNSSISVVYQKEMDYSSQLHFSRKAREVGVYTCLVQNTFLGQRRRVNASIFVRGKPITLNKSDNGLDQSSGAASFVCSFEAYPVAVIEWRWNNGTHNKTIKPNINGSVFELSELEIKSNNWTKNMSKLSIKVPEYLGRTVISCCSSNGNENLCETFSRFNAAIAILGNVTYRIYGHEEEKNYSGAQIYCNSNNAKLVKIPNAWTQKELTTHLAGFTRSVFTGGFRSLEDDFIWKWSDGSSFYNETGRRDTTNSGSYTSWSDGEPNEPENGCLSLNKTKAWNWTDADCNATTGFICERNVSGIPDHFVIDVENCTSNITVTWIAGLGAIGVEHSTEFRGHHSKAMSAEETHSIIPFDQTVITQRSSGLQFDETYNITITVCPDCPHPYSITKRATTYTMLPASNVTVTRADVSLQNDSCVISWLANTRGIIGYMIVTSSKLSRVSSSKYSHLIFTNDTLLGNQNEHVQISEPNRIYSFTVQAQSCLGFGLPVKANGSCITEVAAPASLPVPSVHPTMNGDGTKTIYLNVVDETNGPISCMFVLVTYEPDSTNNGSVMYNLPRLQKASEKAKSGVLDSTESYLALAINESEISSFTESGERITRTLGDETQTECYVGTDPNTNRRKRSTSSSVKVVGTNRKLEDRASYSIFTVTTTPGSEEVFFQTSPQQFIETESVSLLSGGELAGIVIGVLLMIVIAVIILLYLSKRKRDAKLQGTEALNMQGIQGDKENTYVNVEVENQQPGSETTIPLDKLQETYMTLQANGCEKFQEQFQKLKVEAKKIHYPTEVASNLELKNKNRYKNILPADTSRVILSGSGLDSYINACYVNGFRSLKKFIATQGPLKTTVADFWKMVFEQKSAVIVMLTKCKEKSKVKCEKYWPDVGMEKMFGAITVKNFHEKLHSSYVERNFEVSDATSVARVRQFHFLEWPDHGVPITTTNIMAFCDAVSEVETDKPIIVHCSAGAGRTGAFIGFDILSKEQEALRYIDVYQCVMNMRNQRVDMVQTNDQYVLVHKLLLEKHLFGITERNVDEVSAVLSNEITLREEFENLSVVGPINQTRFGNMPKHQLLNRNADSIPYESNRVNIAMKSCETERPYINASTIESYESDIRLIAAQGPMKDTVQYFWRAILDNDVNTVIMLTRCNEGNKNQCACYWPENEGRNTTMDDITVNFLSVRTFEEVIAREFQVIRDGEEKTIRQFQYQAWNSNEKPNSISDILELADKMRESVRRSHGGRALIHCSDGAGRTGVFCAIVNLIAQVQDGKKVDVFRAVKDLRDCRPGMIQTLDQYKMCYEAVKVYLTSFHVYSNFGVEVREEVQENLYANL